MKSVTIDWDPVAERFVSEGTHRGRRVDINAPRMRPEGEGRHGPSGFSASELLLAAAGSCAAWDVVEIARKQRQDVRSLSVRVEGTQEDEPPWAFRSVLLRFAIRGRTLDEAGLRRAITLAVDRYCSVVATIRGVAHVTTEIEVVEDSDVTDPDVTGPDAVTAAITDATA